MDTFQIQPYTERFQVVKHAPTTADAVAILRCTHKVVKPGFGYMTRGTLAECEAFVAERSLSELRDSAYEWLATR